MVSLVRCQMFYQRVPHGTVPGPLLFLCYINNLPNNVTSRVKLYADDVATIIYTSKHYI